MTSKRAEFVERLLLSGDIEITTRGQLAMRVNTREEAERIASRLGPDWFVVTWSA